MNSILVISSLFGLAVSQTTTLSLITLPFVGYDAQTLAASVVGVQSQVTTLKLGCVEEECGLFPNHTLKIGPSTYNMDMSDPNTDFTATVDCVIASSSAVCKETAGGSEANFPGSSTETYDASQIDSVTVLITAGLDKLTAGGSASATGSPAAGASRTSAGVAQSTGSDAASGSAGPSRSGSAAPASSTGAAAANAVAMGSGALTAAGLIIGWLL